MTRVSEAKIGIDQPCRLFILAVFGLHFAFMPLLILLLPRRVESLFGAGAAAMLSWLLLIGAVTASIANIAAGHLGDTWLRRHGNRRGLIVIGLVLLISSFIPLALATEITELAMAIGAFQIGLNLALSPTMAVLADHIPVVQKGTIAGFIGAALPLSAVGTTIVGWAFPVDDNLALYLAAAIVLICTAPLIILWGFEPIRPPAASSDVGTIAYSSTAIHRLAMLWLARLLVQLSASFVLLYLFLHVVGLIAQNAVWQGQNATDIIAIVSLLGAIVAVPAAILCGRLSDRLAARQTLLICALLVLFLSLALLGSNPAPLRFGIAFVLFQVGLSAYLSVDAALVAQLISEHPKRGRILGIMNLTNTIPAILAPLVTLNLVITVGNKVPYNLIYILSAAGLLTAIAAVHRSRLV